MCVAYMQVHIHMLAYRGQSTAPGGVFQILSTLILRQSLSRLVGEPQGAHYLSLPPQLRDYKHVLPHGHSLSFVF